MRFEPSDRRRVILAAVATAVALPFVLPNRANTPASAPVLGGQDLGAELRPADPADPAASTSSIESLPPSTIPFIVGPSTSAEPAPILIGVPAPAGANERTGFAGYRSFPPSYQALPRPCWVPPQSARAGTTVTITNLNNARSTTCVVALIAQLPDGHVVGVGEAVFSEIADLIDSPIPVKIIWP